MYQIRCNKIWSFFSGEAKLYREDLSDTKQLLICPVKQTLYLKKNAPVMLIVNLSAKLVKGLCGMVVHLNEDHVEVHFKSIDKTVKIFLTYSHSIVQKRKWML
jgi:hypothetical protein